MSAAGSVHDVPTTDATKTPLRRTLYCLRPEPPRSAAAGHESAGCAATAAGPDGADVMELGGVVSVAAAAVTGTVARAANAIGRAARRSVRRRRAVSPLFRVYRIRVTPC